MAFEEEEFEESGSNGNDESMGSNNSVREPDVLQKEEQEAGNPVVQSDTPGKNIKSKSKMWQHFERTEDGKQVKCLICSRKFPWHKSTSSHLSHLKTQHRDIFKKPIPSIHRFIVRRQKKVNHQVSKDKANELTDAILQIMTLDLRPFDLVSGRGFKNFVRVAVPGYKLPHRTTFSRNRLEDHYEAVKRVVIVDLKDAFHLCLVYNLWTDDFRRLNYISVSAHFVDNKWDMRRIVLGTRSLEANRATGLVIQFQIQTLMDECKIDNLNHHPTLVTGANVQLAGRLLKYHQMKCVTHLLSNVMTTDSMDTMKECESLFKKCRAILQHFTFKSAEVSHEQQELRALVSSLPDDVLLAGHDYGSTEDSTTVPSTNLKSENQTRWGTKFIMLSSFYSNRDVVRSLLNDHDRVDLFLTGPELSLMKGLIDFLTVFKEATEILEGFKYPTISLVIPTWKRLLSATSLNEEQGSGTHEGERQDEENIPLYALGNEERANAIIKMLKNKIHTALLTRLNESHPSYKIYVLASSLDLRMRETEFAFQTVEQFVSAIDYFEDAIDNTQHKTTQKSSSLKDSTAINHKGLCPTTPSQTKSNKFRSLLGKVLSKPRNRPDADIDVACEGSKLKKELSAFLSVSPLQDIEMDDFDLLKWWKEREAVYPILSSICRKLFSIVASASACESLFSTSSGIVKGLRSAIAPHNVDMLLFLHANTPPSFYELSDEE